MVLILSNDGDLSCDLVQDWLDFYHYPYMRFNSWEFLRKPIQVSLINNKVNIEIEGQAIDLDSIHAIWYRKYGLFRSTDVYKRLCANKRLDEELINQLCKEYTKVVDAFIFSLRDRNWLTNPAYINLNKMEVLKIAAECGLETSATYLVNTQEQIANLILEKKVISKSVLDPIIASWGGKHKGMMYTVEVKQKDLLDLPKCFLPSMLQEMITKEYELRIFYINGQMYSMAIYSQKDKQTQHDFRNYNWKRPNRMVPCRLDSDIKRKLRKLMNRIHLNCGSIDLIKSTDGKLYFLEVNPTGQFGMVDFPCNYGLHKLVAEQLIKMDKDGTKKVI